MISSEVCNTSNISKKCLLCLYEKLVVITYPRQHELLNERSELFYKYRHETKYLLKNFRVRVRVPSFAGKISYKRSGSWPAKTEC